MGTYFKLDEKPGLKGYKILSFVGFEYYKTDGSYGVLPARLLHMTYPQYLDFCEQKLGAKVIRKFNAKYVSIYFPESAELKNFLKVLNTLFENSIKKV